MYSKEYLIVAGLEKPVGRRTMTDNEPIFSIRNFVPSDKMTDGEILEKEKIKFFLLFNYVNNLVIKCFIFTFETSNFHI